MKASWNGYLSLSSLKVPVQLYSATRQTATHFMQLHALDKSPTGRATICLEEDKRIPASEVVRAVKKGDRYIELSDSDLARYGEDEKSITVRQFSDPCAIKPQYYDKPFYVVPLPGGELAYTILRQAFVKTSKIAVVTYVYYQKEHIGIVTAEDGLLMLQQLRYASEIVPRSDIETTTLPQPTPSHVDLAVRLMERYSTPFYLEDYRNEQQARLNDVIDRKAKGLGPKRSKTIASKATEEKSVVPALEELLNTKDTAALPS